MPLKNILPALVCAIAVTAAVLPGVATAATITRDGSGTLVFTAAEGAKNRVNVMPDEGGAINFYTSGGDLIAPIAAGCVQSDIWPGEVVTCSAGTAVRVELGDGDDSATISEDIAVPVVLSGGPGSDQLDGSTVSNTLDGGPGDDRLNGGEGDDILLGGDGNDDIQGKDGRDQLRGGAGDDLLAPDGHEHANADLVDGGPGFDSIESDYSSRFSSVEPLVSITLGGGDDDGRPGEGDDLANVERVWLSVGGTLTGSDGPDELRLSQVGDASVLTGNGGDDNLRAGDGSDRLDGGPGADTVDGGFGDDIITGGAGRDRIFGDMAAGDCGPLWCKYPYGNDTIDAVDGEADSITCGFGTDSVRADAADVVDKDCEAVTRATATGASGAATGRPAAAGRTVKLIVLGRPSLAAALRDGVRVRVSGARPGPMKLILRQQRTAVAQGRVNVPAAGGATARVRFTAKARKRLRRARRLSLIVTGGPGTTKLTLVR